MQKFLKSSSVTSIDVKYLPRVVTLNFVAERETIGEDGTKGAEERTSGRLNRTTLVKYIRNDRR